MKLIRIALALAILSCLPGTAFAQPVSVDQASEGDRAAARELTMAGLDALDRKDYAAAEKNLEHASTILWAPTIGLGLARARVALGKLVSAQDAYSRVTATPVTRDSAPAFQQAILDANRELQALRPRLPKVIITVRGAAPGEVTLDGARISPGSLGAPRPVDPGHHVIRARAPGFAPAEATVTLAESATQNVVLELKPGDDTSPIEPPAPPARASAVEPGGTAPAERPSTWTTQRTLALSAGGVGVVGLVIGGVVGTQAISSNNSSKTDCSPTNPHPISSTKTRPSGRLPSTCRSSSPPSLQACLLGSTKSGSSTSSADQ
jgi:hypothetical protein